MPVRISVAMATYNGETFLAEQLRSIAAQGAAPLELVVRDDGSSDDTLPILRSFAAQAAFPVRILPPGPRLGFADNFLAAADACEGDYVAFSDQDDVWLPHKLQTVSETIEKTQRPVIVVHSAQEVDSQLRPLPQQPAPYKRSHAARLKADPMLPVRGFVVTVRRDAFGLTPHAARPHDTGALSERVAHDVWAYHCANMLGSVVTLPDRLALYRRHEASVTSERRDRDTSGLVERIRHADVDYLLRVARFFAEVAVLAPDAEARAVYRIYAEVLRSRTELYQPRSSLPHRVARLRSMLAARAANRAGEVLPVSTLVKDLMFSAIGPKAA